MRKRVEVILLAWGLLLAMGQGPLAAAGDNAEGLPLAPARTIELTVNEGTWLSLDVSPDGRSIVFDLLGDLYTLPIEGGEAQPLTSGMAFDSQPRYSPDGRWIAYLSDRDGAENLWLLPTAGGEPKKLSQDTEADFASPSWTPDGSYVLVSRVGKGTVGLRPFELWMYHVHGGSGVQITKSAGDRPRRQRHNALGAVASPDGRFLYYTRRLGGAQYNATFPMWQIGRRDRRTGDEDVLTQALGSAFRPVLSPDGTLLVYGTRHDARTGLRVRNLRSGEDRWLHYPVQRDDQESVFTRDLLPGYAFTPDGRDLVVAYGGRIHRLPIAGGEAREIPFTARVSLELGPRLDFPYRVDDGAVRARLIQGAVLSPDGGTLAFSALAQLYLKALPDGEPRRLTTGPAREFQPAFSPDGEWIVYVTWEAGDGGGLWKVRADGSGTPQRLSEGSAFYSEPVFSPDGGKIVALRGSAYDRLVRTYDLDQAPGMDLVWLPAAGGEARLIVPARGVGRPHFGPEQDRVYVYSGAGLISIKLDGTDRRVELQVKGPGDYVAEEAVAADDVRIRPAGDWALAHARGQLYLLVVPRVGGEAPTVNVEAPAVPLRKLTDVGANDFGWAGDDIITWSVGSTFYQRNLDTVSLEDEKKDQEAEKEDNKKKSKKKQKSAEEQEKPSRQESFATAVEVIVEVPRHRPEGTIVLSGATVVTMRGDEVMKRADIVVRGDRIAAVGVAGEVEIPPSAHRVDAGGLFIVPGFIDTHAHWIEIRRGVLDLRNWSFRASLAYGVTTGLDPQTTSPDMFAYQDLIDAGEVVGPRTFSTGPGVFSDHAFASLEQAEAVVERYRNHYRIRNLKAYIVGNRKQRQWIVEACRKYEMMPTTEGGLDFELELTHVIDGFAGNEHAFPIVPLYDDVVELVARSGIGYTPTLLMTYGGPLAELHFYATENVHDDVKLRRFVPHDFLDFRSRRLKWSHPDEQVYPQIAAQAAKIVRAGGRVGVGAHGQLQGLGYHWEMWALASGGLSNHEVLRAATLHGAEMIGLSQDLGSIEPGKLADLVVLAHNPLADVRNTNTIRWVMKNGELFDGDTLDQVWPEQKSLSPPWWWDQEPNALSSDF
ncbi:MAG: amidohydrolase family protein [bacterium]|nr:amidohydrolase family protein [bacterium]